MKKYILVQWVFNYGAWSRAIADGIEIYGMDEFSRMMDVHTNTLRNWMKEPHNHDFPYPNMTNFTKLIRLLDYDPRDFFHTEDIE